ncbi:hypothetical protein LN460_21260, partial [Xanthomonas vesicatoria]|nr:hypothetical protein [Xanthomonas vesicatoria]
EERGHRTRALMVALLKICTPTIVTGPCPPTIAGPYAAWMPRKSLHGRTCGVSCNGRRARALQKTYGVERAALSPLAGNAVNPSMGLDGGIHAANGPTSGEGTAPDSWLVLLLKNEDIAPER